MLAENNINRSVPTNHHINDNDNDDDDDYNINNNHNDNSGSHNAITHASNGERRRSNRCQTQVCRGSFNVLLRFDCTLVRLAVLVK